MTAAIWILAAVVFATAITLLWVRKRAKPKPKPEAEPSVALHYHEEAIVVCLRETALVLRNDGKYHRLGVKGDTAHTLAVRWAASEEVPLGRELFRSAIAERNVRKLDDSLIIQGVSMPNSVAAFVFILYSDGTWSRRVVSTRRASLVRV